MVYQRRYKRGKKTHRRKTRRVKRSRVKRSRVNRTRMRGGTGPLPPSTALAPTVAAPAQEAPAAVASDRPTGVMVTPLLTKKRNGNNSRTPSGKKSRTIRRKR